MEKKATMNQKTPILLLFLLLFLGCSSTCWCLQDGDSADGKAEKTDEVKTGDFLVGKHAPDFTLTDVEGKEFHLSDHSDKVVVLEWMSPDCSFTKRLYVQLRIPTLAKQYINKGVVWVSMNSAWYSHPINMKKWLEQRRVKYPMLLDKDGKVGEAYHARVTPEFYVIDRGKVVYHGAIDDDIWGRKTIRAEHLALALEQVSQGKTVDPVTARVYGTGIRYLKAGIERKRRLEEMRRKAREAREAEEKETEDGTNSGGGR